VDNHQTGAAAMNSRETTAGTNSPEDLHPASTTCSNAIHGDAVPRQTPAGKKWANLPSIVIYTLRSQSVAIFIALLVITFLAYFYAADLKGIWNDEAVRLTIANGGVATAPLGKRYPGHSADVLKAIGNFATQPLYVLLVNRILRITHSYSLLPILTANLLIFLFSSVGVYLLAHSLLNAWGALVSVFLYLWNGFAMVHVLQTREYSLILCLFVWNTVFFYWLFKGSRVRGDWIFWLIAFAHFLTSVAMLYATNWAPFFLWPEAVVALLLVRRQRLPALTVFGNLALAALCWLPWVLRTPANSTLFVVWDPRRPSLGLLLKQFQVGTEHLLIGSQQTGWSLLAIYYWMLLAVLISALAYLAFRFLRQRFEIQHLVLTILGFLTFQVGYFFLREPLSTTPRYFILYLPYVVLLIGVALSRLVNWLARSVTRRAWLQLALLLIVATAGLAEIRQNYRNPYVDHGPDFRLVYRYLASRVAPGEQIIVGLRTNFMALNYYWPNPDQIQFGYPATPKDRIETHPKIWTVSYYDEESPAYRKYADYLKSIRYELTMTEVISGVTIRCFRANSQTPELQSGGQHQNAVIGPKSDGQSDNPD
jgi:hypothetical protein